MRIVLFILLAAILTNCTFQKRVHRKGWHVEWRKAYKSDDLSAQTDREKDISLTENREEIRMGAEQSSVEVKSTSTDKNGEISNEIEAPDDVPEEFESTNDKQVDENVPFSSRQTSLTEHNQERRVLQEKHQTQSRSSGNSGNALLITGALLLLIGLIALLILAFTADLGAVIVGVLIFAVLGGLGIVLLLTGLIVVLVT